MLPECRLNEYTYPIPPFEIEKDNVEDFADELQMFHGKYSDCFARSEPRKTFYGYMIGLISHLERKSVEPIAVNVNGIKSVRSMQRTISDAVWYEDMILYRHQDMVCVEMGDKDGIQTFDESGFTKKGSCSAGVSRQYCGETGKVDNCQNGVFAGYASPKGYTLIDKRLFIPKKWFGDDYVEKRNKCKFPEDISFKSKPELAAVMYRDIVRRDAIPFRYVVADTIYGNSSEFIDAVESDVGKIYMVSMPHNTLFWLRPPVTKEHSYQYKGELHSKTVLADNEKSPISFNNFAKNLHNCFWYKRIVSEGTKGPIKYEFTNSTLVN